MYIWFAALSVLAVWRVFGSPGFDYRLVVLGAVLPVGEAAFGGPRLLHTLVGAVVALVAVMAITQGRGKRLVRRRLLGLPIGLFFHLVLDGIWARSHVFWWPFFGWSFGSAQVPELTRGLFGVLLELIGAAVMWWLWKTFDLRDADRRRQFIRTGRLDPGAET